MRAITTPSHLAVQAKALGPASTGQATNGETYNFFVNLSRCTLLLAEHAVKIRDVGPSLA